MLIVLEVICFNFLLGHFHFYPIFGVKPFLNAIEDIESSFECNEVDENFQRDGDF